MSIESSLRSYLLADSDISALVGDRIYPMTLPANSELPAIVYQTISNTREQVMNHKSGIAHPRIQLTCWCDTYSEVKNLAEKVRLRCDSIIGTVGSDDALMMIVDDMSDVIDIRPTVETNRKYGVRVDVVIWYLEPTS